MESARMAGMRGRAAGAALALASVWWLLPSGPASSAPDTYTGIASAYVRGPFERDFRLSGTLTLDRIPANRSWYCNWLMLAARRDEQLDQPFVQAGFIRWAANGYRLSAFIAQGHDGRRIDFDDLALLDDGPHDVELRGSGGVLHVVIDGKDLRTVKLSSLFDANDRVYGQIAGEVHMPGDSLRASFTRLTEAPDTGTPRPYAGTCRRYDRGLHLERRGNVLVVIGRFDASAESGFDDCGIFFDDLLPPGATAIPPLSR
jgi:hypothetical protein